MLGSSLLDLRKPRILFGQVAGVLVLLSAAIAATAAPVQVKSVAVDARLMKFPGFSIDGIDYDALTFSYGTQGGVEVVAINDGMETLSCNGQPKQNHYLAVDYRGPEVIFRIQDQRKNRVLLLQQLDTNGTYAYGQGVCGENSNLQARFEEGKSAWLTSMKQQLLAAAHKQMQTYMQDNAALSYEDMRFPLFYFGADGSRFEELNQAFDRAREAFDLSTQFGITVEADETLIEVAKIWEKEVKALSNTKVPDPDADQVRLALHRNLTQVYLFVRKFDLARRHDAMALSKGMLVDDSRQSVILEHERRTVLSPQVAANLVLAANLYRYGQNAMQDKQLTEVEDFSELKQALSQR